jgi:cell wall-associated NlpC family hydrolase
MTEQQIIDKYLGVPYLHKGRDLKGLDCWGLIILVYKDLDMTVLDFDIDYDQNWSFKKENYFIENYHKQWVKIEVPETPKLFDVVLFNSRNGIPNHAGIVMNGTRFIHTCKAGTVLGRVNNMTDKIEGYYRIK